MGISKVILNRNSIFLCLDQVLNEASNIVTHEHILKNYLEGFYRFYYDKNVKIVPDKNQSKGFKYNIFVNGYVGNFCIVYKNSITHTCRNGNIDFASGNTGRTTDSYSIYVNPSTDLERVWAHIEFKSRLERGY